MDAMLDDLNRELAEVKELQRKQRKLQGHLESAQGNLERENARLDKLAAEMSKEGRDVEKLENLSLTGLFYTVLGSKEEQLDKERQEYLAAKLAYDRCKYAVRALKEDVAALQSELARLGDVDARFQAILDRKEKLLSQAQDERARKLVALTEDLADAQSENREVVEAIQAGEAAQQGLKRVIDATRSARNWGVWDMFGGGLLATAVKHSHIDDARDAAYQVQDLLRRFKRELADVGSLAGDVVIDLSSFETFADYFFDGLIVDWIVQSKIDRSLDSAVKVSNQIGRILESLSRKQASNRTRIDQLKAEKQRLVEGAD